MKRSISPLDNVSKVPRTSSSIDVKTNGTNENHLFSRHKYSYYSKNNIIICVLNLITWDTNISITLRNIIIYCLEYTQKSWNFWDTNISITLRNIIIYVSRIYSKVLKFLRHKHTYYSKKHYNICVSNLLNSRHKYIYYSKKHYNICVSNILKSLEIFETQTYLLL